MEHNRTKLSILALMLILPLVAKANMIWPSIYIVDQYYTWYIIAAGLLIELLAAKFFLKVSWPKSALMVVVMNAISALAGLILIPLSGILLELLLLPTGTGTFDLSHWIADYILVVLLNTCVEGLALKVIFKSPFKTNFWWLFGANAISVIICAFMPLLQPH